MTPQTKPRPVETTAHPEFRPEITSNFEVEERAARHRGGVAGLAGSVGLVLAAAVYPIFDMPSPDHIDSLINYRDFATGRIIENSAYMAALLLWAISLMAIGRTLRNRHTGTRPMAPAIALIGLGPW